MTGGAGFLGSHLIDSLLAAGLQVDALDDLSQGYMDNLRSALKNERCEFHLGSVLDVDRVAHLVERADIVFHLAALVGMNTLMESRTRILDVNAKGTYRILDACARGRKRILFFSSSEVYGGGGGKLLKEDRPLNPGSRGSVRWLYAVAKICSERAAAFLRERRGLPVILVRPFNAVGVRQSASSGMVLPNFIRSAQRGEPIRVFGSGRQSRTFIAVEDLIHQVIGLALDDRALGLTVNVGGSEEISMYELACRVKEILRSPSPIKRIPYEEAYEDGYTEIMRRRPDLSLLESLGHRRALRPIDDVIRSMATFIKESA